MYWQLEQSETPSSNVDLDVLWVDAHKNKEGVIDNEQVQEVANRVITLKEKAKAEGHQISTVCESFTHPRHNIPILEFNYIPKLIICFDNILGIRSCKLFLDIPSTRVVGTGTMHNTRNAKLHNARISPNHVRVATDIAIEDDALLSIPVDEDIITLGGTIDTFYLSYYGNVTAEHNATSPPRVEHASKKTKVVKSKHKGNKPRSKSSNKESSGEVVSKNTNYYAQLMKYLYDNLISTTKKKVMFFSLHYTTLVMITNDKRKSEQTEHVADILIKHKEDVDLFIAPFNTSVIDYTLLVIDYIVLKASDMRIFHVVIDYTMSGENFEEKRERRAFQEQGALGLILELEKR
ncbi:hypothetical protein Lal_00002464 [Lupinus albus]|nr:hypothetical protein Lal_00002464 [Lupinus albus]